MKVSDASVIPAFPEKAIRNAYSAGIDSDSILYLFNSKGDTGINRHLAENITGGRDINIFAFDLARNSQINIYVDNVYNSNTIADTSGIIKKLISLGSGNHLIELICNNTSIGNEGNKIPTEFKLYQNYPNPFNPVTKIRFEVPLIKGGLKGVVSLKIYDVLGKEITTLVNEKKSPGSYEISFDGSNLPSGVYYYKIIANEFSDVKCMIIIK